MTNNLNKYELNNIDVNLCGGHFQLDCSKRLIKVDSDYFYFSAIKDVFVKGLAT